MQFFKRLKNGDHPYSNAFILAGILLFGVILRLTVLSGITGGDDMIYAYDIHKVSHGNFEPGISHWSLRLGFIFPVALFAHLFGFNEYALILYPLFCSLGGILLMYFFGKLLFHENIGLLAAFLLSFFPLDVFFATMVFVDLPLGFFMGLSVFYFLKGEKQQQNIRYYMLSGIFLGISYLTKITGLYLGLFFIGYILVERRIKLKHAFVIVGFLCIFFLESGYYYFQTGNPIYQVSILAQEGHWEKGNDNKLKTVNPGDDPSFFKGKSAEGLAVLRGNNWWLEPIFTFTTNQEFGFFYYAIFPMIAYLMIKKDTNIKLLLIWMIPLTLYILYGSVSPFHFNPLRRWPRYLYPIAYPSILILAYFLSEKKYWIKGKFSTLTAGFLLITSLICIWGFNDGPTDSYVVKQIAEFNAQHPQKSLLIYWRMYRHLGPFIEYQKSPAIKIYGLSQSRYDVDVIEPDSATDSYIAVPLYDYGIEHLREHPNWELVHTIIRPKKSYCPILENFPGMPNGVKEKLCPTEICEIYLIP